MDELENEGAAVSFGEPTAEPSGKGFEFHVAMRTWAMQNMEQEIVNAAAEQIIGGFGTNTLARQIEAKCMEALNAKATAALAGVADSIIDQPLTPAYGDKKPVTMREFIGLVGREYLTQRVDRDGNPSTGGYASNTTTRVELLVSKHLDRHFKQEIEKATCAAINEVKAAIAAEHKAMIEAEKKRLREAIGKAVA